MAMMNSINGFPVSMAFVPPPPVTPMDASAFMTPQQKTAAEQATKGGALGSLMGGGNPMGGGAPAGGAPAGGAPADPLAPLPAGGGAQGGGLMDAIMKMIMSGGMGA